MGSQAPAVPPQVAIMQMVNGMVVSRCICLCAELAVADHLKDGPRSLGDLAAATGSDADSLYRILRTLSGLGVFTELADQRFENNPLSETLRSDVPGSVRNLARWLGHPMHWRVTGDLDHSVRTGRPSVNKEHPDQSPFSVLARDTSAQATFNSAMTGHSQAAGQAIVQSYDFTPYRRIVDVGGGHGTLSLMIAKVAPAAHIVINDLPHVVEGARKNIEAAGLADRIEVAGGSFFDGVPGPADLCVLKWILHLCDDASARRILGHCRGALEPGGKLIVCEMLVTPGPDSLPARIMDIEMLIGTGGRERTEAEFARLFADSGLQLARVIPTPTPLRILEVALA